MKVRTCKDALHIFIITLMIGNILSQDTCSSVSSPKAYSSCQPYDNSTAQTVCCYIRGLYGGSNGTACLSMDILFANRTLSYTLNDITATMVCGNNTISSSYYTTSISIISLMCILIVF